MKLWNELWAAFGFLTRLPTPRYTFDSQTFAYSAKFFPVVGLVVAFIAYVPYWLLAAHVSNEIRCVLVLCALVLISGGLHEDGLADVADGFGGGWTRDRVLEIMRDSRIGSYGAIAIVLSLILRMVLLNELGPTRLWPFLAGAHVLSRWSALPLSFVLPPARVGDGKGALLAGSVSRGTFVAGTALMVLIGAGLLRAEFLAPVVGTVAAVLASAAYYRRRIGGITGDCFGATNQLVEIVVYLCGVWR